MPAFSIMNSPTLENLKRTQIKSRFGFVILELASGTIDWQQADERIVGEADQANES